MERDPAFEVTVERPGDRTVVVAARGELDMLSAPELEAAVRDVGAPGARVIIDLHELEFIDSTGVHLMLDAFADSRRDGWELALRGAHAEVRRAFELTGLLDRLPFLDRG